MRNNPSLHPLESFADKNIAAATLLELAKDPPRPALIIQKASKASALTCEYQEISADELIGRILRLTVGFRQRGYQRGHRAIIMEPPGLNFFVVTFACFLYGLIPIFIDPGMDKRSLRRSVIRSRPDLFIGIAKAHLARWVLRLCPGGLRDAVLTEDGHKFPGTIALAKIYANDCSDNDMSQLCQAMSTQEEGMAALLFTSGSTGPAKGAIYTHSMFLAQVRAIRNMFQITRDDVDLATFPLFALFAPALGMPAVVPDMDFRKPAQVRAEVIFAAIAKYQVSNFFGSPALLKRLADESAKAGERLVSLRRVISAGAPVSYKLISTFKTMLPPHCQLYTPYGATESMPIAWISGEEVLARQESIRTGQGIPVGHINPELDVRIISILDKEIKDWAESLNMPVGQIGEIIVAGPVVSQAYLDQVDADALQKIYDHEYNQVFHRLGDLGYFSADGTLWFCGRKSQRVQMTRQLSLYTICIEALFNEHPAVARSALTALPGADTSRVRAILWVELRNKKCSKADRALLIQDLQAIAANHPQAKFIEQFLIHPAFPVDTRHNAKIFREKLGLAAAKTLKWQPH